MTVFREFLSCSYVPALLPWTTQPRQARGTFRKKVYKTYSTMILSLRRCVNPRLKGSPCISFITSACKYVELLTDDATLQVCGRCTFLVSTLNVTTATRKFQVQIGGRLISERRNGTWAAGRISTLALVRHKKCEKEL